MVRREGSTDLLGEINAGEDTNNQNGYIGDN